jgi:hypothetical protein
MSSADYQAYVQAEQEECRRRANAYQGVIPDAGAVSEHLSIDHLERLLSGPLTQDLRTLYLKEYDEIRASLRALALVGMTRKDMYDHASQEMQMDRERLAGSVSFNRYYATRFKKDAPKVFKEKLEAEEVEFQNRKNEVVDRIRAEVGAMGSKVTDKDVVRKAMKSTGGVNSRGMSTGVKEID